MTAHPQSAACRRKYDDHAAARGELARAEATLAAIRDCAASSPRQVAWLARTEAGVRLMRAYYHSKAARLVEDGDA